MFEMCSYCKNQVVSYSTKLPLLRHMTIANLARNEGDISPLAFRLIAYRLYTLHTTPENGDFYAIFLHM